MRSSRFQPHFECYAHRASTQRDRPALMACNIIFAELIDQGQARSMALYMDPHFGTRVIDLNADPGLFQSIKDKLASAAYDGERLVESAPNAVTAEELVRFSELNEELEWKRTMYIIEPDLCMHVVPPEIWLAKLDIPLVLQALPGTQNPDELVKRFHTSHARRYINAFQNRCTDLHKPVN